MKIARLFIIPVFALALAGCTINHYHYYGQAPIAVKAIDSPGQAVLQEKLKGIHTAMEITANNIANINTNAYKALRPTFIENQASPTVSTDWTSGNPIITNSSLDLFINGEGFFRVGIDSDKGGGFAYTRVGSFFVNRDGELVLGNAQGSRLADGITIPDDAVDIFVSSNGEFTVIMPDNTTSAIGEVELHRFINPDGLTRDRSGLYIESEASGPSISGTPGEGAMGTLMQGQIESSNVHLFSEIVEMEKLRRWGDAIANELGVSAKQHHTYLAMTHQAAISNQVDLIRAMEDAYDVVLADKERRVEISPSLKASQ